METHTENYLTINDLQAVVVVTLHKDFGATFKQIAEVLNLKQTEAKEIYMRLIRSMENSELSQKTQTQTI